MYDARRAGFRDLVFIIKREHEALFRERIGTRMERFSMSNTSIRS